MPDLRVLLTDDVPSLTLAASRQLMDLAFGERFSDEDWTHALGGTHVVLVDGADVLAHGSVVRRLLEVDGVAVETGYVEAVATTPSRQREGLASIVVDELGDLIRRTYAMGCLSTSRHAFYERLGWERWLGPTYVRDGRHLIRTEDEDDGILVLRFGPSATADRTTSLTCEARPGDDW